MDAVSSVKRQAGEVGGVVDFIGGTPLVEVSRLSPTGNIRLFAKLENQNPFGSVKDRIALAMIKDAYATGRLVKN